jgi:hypothetical protein
VVLRIVARASEHETVLAPGGQVFGGDGHATCRAGREIDVVAKLRERVISALLEPRRVHRLGQPLAGGAMVAEHRHVVAFLVQRGFEETGDDDLGKLPLVFRIDQRARSSDRPLRGPLSLLFQTVFHWPWFARYMKRTDLNHGWPSVKRRRSYCAGRRRSRRRRRAIRESAGS